MYPKFAIVALLVLAAGSPTHCFAKASPVVVHARPVRACDQLVCAKTARPFLEYRIGPNHVGHTNAGRASIGRVNAPRQGSSLIQALARFAK